MQKGDVIGALQWVDGEPALILAPARRKPGGGVFVLCESAIPRYVRSEAYMLQRAREAAKVMGMDDSPIVVHRIVDCFMEWIPDLLAMPPKPHELKRVVDEALIHVNGKEIHAQRYQ